ncbi:ATP-dependent DNA helicase PIF2-like [Arachis ipaensis]|uniref:ATP-dependent DNA helicase PIF2-like n=1 Tax=Arachis ipaensis TaxID=130454 RepID=UPI0007AEFEB9|nr:ATP-dependent DNA helicase PIF2-like [Arachis ipaensis]
MPFPDSVDSIEPPDTVFFDELNFDKIELASISVDLVSLLNRDQRVAYDTIVNAVTRGMGGFFFVYGYGGTGKTFLWNVLSASIRLKGHIVLNMASSGIAALLLPNGRTAHSRFKVPLSVNQDSICNIKQGTPLAHLISSAKLIIWDEAPMLNKFCFEALDKCLKDVLRFNHGYNPDAPFGGKVVVLGGDFLRILPVIPRGSREEIVHSCINASNLWQCCQVLQLAENMRLGCGAQDIHNVQLEEFADWLLQIGDGLLGDSTDGKSVIRIPDNLLLYIESPGLHDLVLFVYPNILLHTSSVDYFKDRSILAPTLDVVIEVNNHVMSLIPGNERVYLSSDTLLNEDGHLESELYTMSTESLNALNCSGIPQHRLVLKIGVPMMLLRNIDQSNGLCNSTRM